MTAEPAGSSASPPTAGNDNHGSTGTKDPATPAGTHPYLTLISAELTRAEGDLTGFRARALTVITTSAGVVTFLVGLVTFAASKSEEERGLDVASIVLIGVSLAGFVLAGVLALVANMPRTIKRPSSESLQGATEPGVWRDGADDLEHQRFVAGILVPYVETVRAASDETANRVTQAIGCQIFGLAFAAAAVIVAMSRL